MIEFIARLPGPAEAAATVTLPFDLRQKSRLRVTLSNGAEAAIMLPRGTVLRHGDQLRTSTGLVATVIAAPESVSIARAEDPHLLARACYHLGNRHVPLQIGAGWLRYGHDHVLDGMVRQLGLSVEIGQEAFEPESGAYAHSHDTRLMYRHGH